MKTKFDFGDGLGPVPAKRHPNGGGWVADSAYVYDSNHIGPEAVVFGRASVCGSVITDRARISGTADVRHSHVSGQAVINEFAKVWTSNISGSAVITVQAQVNRCTIGGNVEIRGHAIVDDVTLTGNERITRRYNPDLIGPAKDVAGRLIEAGQRVVRAVPSKGGHQSSDLEICEVSRVDGTRVWLNGSKTPIHSPDRLAVIA